MTRSRRIKAPHHTYATYHCITRTVNAEKLLNDSAKDILRKQINQLAQFCGVHILTYAIMDNHFHLLLSVPPKQNLSDQELIRRYQILYPKPTQYASMQINVLKATLKANGPEAQRIRDQMHARMHDLSAFMQSLKQRFSVWFNRTHNRFGTLWAERFTSTLVESNNPFALQTVAAYIDLNPLRAGLVKDPKDYRWCGYADALAGNTIIRQNLRSIMPDGKNLSDDALLAAYRMTLFGKGSAPKAKGSSSSAVIEHKAFEKVMKKQGQLSVTERLHHRVRWFAKGAVIGTEAFVNDALARYREQTQRRQRHKVRSFSEDTSTQWPELYALRGGQF